jgi:hypothetical protein
MFLYQQNYLEIMKEALLAFVPDSPILEKYYSIINQCISKTG